MATDKTATVRKLLAKAESATSVHEAELFREKATALMVQYSINEAELTAEGHSTDTLGTLRIVLTGGYAKVNALLLQEVTEAFGGKTIRVERTPASVMMVYAWQSDLDMIEVLFSSLQVQAMREAKREHARYPYINGRSWTTSFVVGFAVKVGERLTAQRAKATQESTTTGTELALYDRSRAVEQFYRTQHSGPVRTSRTGGSAASGYHSGQAAGNRADLGQGGLGGRRAALAR